MLLNINITNTSCCETNRNHECSNTILTFIKIVLFLLLTMKIDNHFTFLGRDLSFNKATSQSSVHNGWYSFGPVDGVKPPASETSDTVLGKTCFRTIEAYLPWWSVDLERLYSISSIIVYGCSHYLGRNITDV